VIRYLHKELASTLLLVLFALCPALANSQPKGNPAMPCYRALASDPRFELIRDRVALGPTTDEMHRKTKSLDRVTKEEVPVLLAWKSAREVCHQKELPYFATRDSEIAELARKYFAAVQALIGDLQAGGLTYAEFGSRRVGLYEKLNRDIEAIRQSIMPSKPIPHTPGK